MSMHVRGMISPCSAPKTLTQEGAKLCSSQMGKVAFEGQQDFCHKSALNLVEANPCTVDKSRSSLH